MSLNLEGQAIRQVQSFRMLGSLLNENDRCDAEIKSRTGIVESNFG